MGMESRPSLLPVRVSGSRLGCQRRCSVIGERHKKNFGGSIDRTLQEEDGAGAGESGAGLIKNMECAGSHTF